MAPNKASAERGKRPRSWMGIVLALSLITSSALSLQRPRFEITPDAVLLDQRFNIVLDGLDPNEEVTIRADGHRGVWRSSATFRSDDRGRIEVADPMRLVWSASSDKPLGASPSNRNIGHTACGCVSVIVDRAFREQSRAAGRSCR
jgi:Acyl-CoA thioester hydrolase/BAAT N-terminal region